MPTIYDNIEKKFSDAVLQHIANAKRVDYCVGYFNIRGWKTVCNEIDNLDGMEILEEGYIQKRYCRLLVGMTKNPFDTLLEELDPESAYIDNEKAAKTRRKLAEEFRKQLELGAPTNSDEKTIKHLLSQLKNGRVVVKLFMEYQLHAKLYLSYTSNSLTNCVALLGSSNFTFSGLKNQGELNVDVLEQDAADKLANWFNKRWNSRWCIDITKELIDVIENSWAREETIPPYFVYMKMAYHLSQEARNGISEFKLPREFQNSLLDFQKKAVLIACQHINKRNGVMIGDVVGLGKTITACAIAKIMEEDLLLNTLILCPKNLVSMWDGYVEKYGLHARVLSHSMIISELPKLKRYRLVIVDESHNFRNSENETYKVVKSYLEENESRVILLSATPYNKTYKDLASQLKLFIPEDYDIGIGPEHYIAEIGGQVQFHMKHDNTHVHSISAFEHSTNADDWRDLMRLYLIRRTRSFIKTNYAYIDSNNNRNYLEFADGTRSYFPDRIPKRVTFSMSQEDKDDQYAKLYDDEVVSIIDDLRLSRYSMMDYVDSSKVKNATSLEQSVIENLSRAGHRTKGFCRTNLYKRLESSGYSFLLSIERMIIRNCIVLYAINNNFDIPIGNSVSVDFEDEYSDSESDTDVIEMSKERDICDYNIQAEKTYSYISNTCKKRFKWIRSCLFNTNSLKSDLIEDNKKLNSIIRNVGFWNASYDRKLEALYELLNNKHKNEKVIIFSQYSDTAIYLYNNLLKRGVGKIAVATGATKDVTQLVQRFSPISNEYEVDNNDEYNVLISTDVLSEGQNLQDSHIVVNFDLPWALIRLVQRAGRVDRLGQKSATILCYSFLPEDGIEQIIGLREKLRNRIEQNAEVVGSDEVFFDGDPINIADIYSEKSGILDDDDSDEDVDLASYAYQIWKNALDNHPEMRTIIPSMPNVVFSTKKNTVSDDEDSVIVYSKNADGNDSFAWMDKNGKMITQSQYQILKAAECDYGCSAEIRLDNHHELVKMAIDALPNDEYSGMGTLGRRTGIRYKAYMKISRYIETEEIEKNELDKIKRVLDDIYKYPLSERARDILGRELKADSSDSEFVAATITLKEDNRLVISEETSDNVRPLQIICSMGMRKDM